jgi:hypothetical protein
MASGSSDNWQLIKIGIRGPASCVPVPVAEAFLTQFSYLVPQFLDHLLASSGPPVEVSVAHQLLRSIVFRPFCVVLVMPQEQVKGPRIPIILHISYLSYIKLVTFLVDEESFCLGLGRLLLVHDFGM